MRNLPFLLVVSLLSACAPTTDAGAPTVGGKDGATAARDLAGQLAEVPVTDISALYTPPEHRIHKPGRRLISSADAFAGYFGEQPPGAINFSRSWVVFAAAGAQRSGGYNTSMKISLNESGRSIKARVVTSGPGNGCAATAAITFPYFIGTIPAGAGNDILPQHVRYYHQAASKPSCTAVCGDDAVQTFADAAFYGGEEVLATSESDYPYVPVNLGTAPAVLNTATVAEAALRSGALDGFLSEQEADFPRDKDQLLALLLDESQGDNEDWDAFSSDDADFETWATQHAGIGEDMTEWDSYDQKSKLGHRQMVEALSRHLTDVRVYYLFDVQVQLFIVGRSACGEILGYHSTLIWT